MADGPRIPGSDLPGAIAPAAQPRRRDRPDTEQRASGRLKRRGQFDPTNIERAIARLVELLSSDGGAPRRDVMPRGFYLDILV
jgi:hypothetical protein